MATTNKVKLFGTTAPVEQQFVLEPLLEFKK